MRRNVLFSLFVSASWSPGIATTGIACASETISRIALREQAWVLKKYVAFRESRFAARQAFLLLNLLPCSCPILIANDSDFLNPHEIYRQTNRIRKVPQAVTSSGHFEIGHTLWFRVVLKVSE